MPTYFPSVPPARTLLGFVRQRARALTMPPFIDAGSGRAVDPVAEPANQRDGAVGEKTGKSGGYTAFSQ